MPRARPARQRRKVLQPNRQLAALQRARRQDRAGEERHAPRSAQEALRESEARYRALVESQIDLISRYRPDTTLTFVNRAYAEFYGRRAEELVGTKLIDTYPVEVREEELARLRRFGPEHTVQLDEGVVPTDTSNLRYEQLAEIWETFGISSPVLPRMSLRGRLSEITEHRNAIAHGRESPAAVGSRYSTGELETRMREVYEVSEYLILTFEDYLIRKGFVNS